MSEVTSKLIHIVIEHLGVEPEKINPEARFAEDLGADSLDLLELVMTIEDDLDIKIFDEEAEAIVTVADMFTLVDRKVIEKMPVFADTGPINPAHYAKD